MIVALLLFALGLSLSAFFSGCETGFYRVTRARLVIAALGGDWISKALLWTASNPSLFVATALVGNNFANYVCSAAIVMGASSWLPGSVAAEFVAPILFAPVIFVYGELLPKSLFFRAPNRLLRRFAPGLIVAGVIFAPVIFVLWLFSRVIELIGRQSPPEIRMVLARRELGQLLDESEAVGLIQPTQQSIAQSALSLGGQPVRSFMSLATRYPKANEAMSPAEALGLAQRHSRMLLPVESADGKRTIVGYVRTSDCLFADAGKLPVQPLLAVSENDTYLATLARMVAAVEPMARVMNLKGQTTGFITLRGLQQALLAD